MKKSVLFLFVLLIAASLNAQSIKFGVGGGMALFQGPESYTKEIPDGIGFANAPFLSLKGKLSLPLLPINFTAGFNYLMLSSKGDGNAAPQLGIPVAYSVENSGSIMQISVGAEYSLLPGPLPLKPYASVDVFVNSYSDITHKYSYKNGTSGEIKGGSMSRTGIAIGVGADFTMLPKIDINVFAKYSFNNMIGKEDKEEANNSINFGALILFSAL